MWTAEAQLSDGPMRIALIPSSYHPYTGGVEEHTRNVARELAEGGHHVEVWTVDRGEHLQLQRVEGIQTRYLAAPLPSMSPAGIWHFVVSFRSAWRAWMKAYRRFRPDVLHVQCFGPNGLYALALHHRTRRPMIVSSHGETFADDNRAFEESRLLRAGLTRALRDTDAVTGCSQLVLDDLAARFGCATGVVVPNGVDLDEETRAGGASLPYTVSATTPIILAIGRMERNKGFDLLLRAFAAARLPATTRLVLAGDGGELPSLERLALDLGVDGRVVFPGRLSRPQVLAAMASATTVVVPSRVEAFGIVVLEAWRSGKPLIATTHGGPAELVTAEVDGLLVDPTDTRSLAAALTRVMSDAGLRSSLGAHGRETVKSFSWEGVANRYLELYTTIS